MSGNPPPSGGGRYRGQDEPLEYWMPAKDIALEVLASDLQLYLGRDATARPADHRDGRPGYAIRSYIPVTIPMIQDLKADSAKWYEERRKGVNSYQSSSTHEHREYYGPTDPPPDPEKRRTEGRAKPVPIPPPPQDRYGDTFADQRSRSPPLSSSQANRAPMARHTNPSQPQRQEYPIQPQRQEYPIQPQRQEYPTQPQRQEYPTQPTQPDPYEWQRQGGTLDTGHGNLAYNDRPAPSESYGPAAGPNRTMPTSADQSGGQRMYTREEVEKLVARELRKAGKREVSTESFRQIVDQQLAKLVDEHFKALQRGQQGQQTQQTQQPKTGETGYPKASAYEQSPGSQDPSDKPKPSQPDPRGSYGHSDYPYDPEPKASKPDYSRHKSKK